MMGYVIVTPFRGKSRWAVRVIDGWGESLMYYDVPFEVAVETRDALAAGMGFCRKYCQEEITESARRRRLSAKVSC